MTTSDDSDLESDIDELLEDVQAEQDIAEYLGVVPPPRQPTELGNQMRAMIKKLGLKTDHSKD